MHDNGVLNHQRSPTWTKNPSILISSTCQPHEVGEVSTKESMLKVELHKHELIFKGIAVPDNTDCK